MAATELCSSSALVDSRSDKNLDLLFLSFKITLCWKLNKLQIGQHFELKWVERFASFEMMTLQRFLLAAGCCECRNEQDEPDESRNGLRSQVSHNFLTLIMNTNYNNAIVV